MVMRCMTTAMHHMSSPPFPLPCFNPFPFLPCDNTSTAFCDLRVSVKSDGNRLHTFLFYFFQFFFCQARRCLFNYDVVFRFCFFSFA